MFIYYFIELNLDVVDGNSSGLNLRQVSTSFAENVIHNALESINHPSQNEHQQVRQRENGQNEQPPTVATLNLSSQVTQL